MKIFCLSDQFRKCADNKTLRITALFRTFGKELDGLIAEMKALDKFNDDVFIQYFEKVGEMQERLSELEKTNKLSSVEYKDCSDKLSEAFEKLKGKLSFCTL